MIKLGRYHVCLLDLVTDDRTHKLSAAKIWRHVCFGIMSKVMLTTDVTWDLMLAFGGVVGSSEVAIMLIKYKYGAQNVDNTDSK